MSEESFDRGEFYPKVKEWVLGEFDGDTYQRFAKNLPSPIVDLLENADPAGWYPVEYSKIIYEKIVSFFGDEHLKGFVKFYVSKAISGFLKGLLVFIKPLDLAKRALALWERFHSTGRPEIEIISPTHGTITLYDWDYSPVHCKVHALWFAELVRIAGGKNPIVAHTHCVHQGDKFCRWKVSYE